MQRYNNFSIQRYLFPKIFKNNSLLTVFTYFYLSLMPPKKTGKNLVLSKKVHTFASWNFRHGISVTEFPSQLLHYKRHRNG